MKDKIKALRESGYTGIIEVDPDYPDEIKTEVCPRHPNERSYGSHGRIDSPDGCSRYFDKRFKEFQYNAGVVPAAFGAVKDNGD